MSPALRNGRVRSGGCQRQAPGFEAQHLAYPPSEGGGGLMKGEPSEGAGGPCGRCTPGNTAPPPSQELRDGPRSKAQDFKVGRGGPVRMRV